MAGEARGEGDRTQTLKMLSEMSHIVWKRMKSEKLVPTKTYTGNLNTGDLENFSWIDRGRGVGRQTNCPQCTRFGSKEASTCVTSGPFQVGEDLLYQCCQKHRLLRIPILIYTYANSLTKSLHCTLKKRVKSMRKATASLSEGTRPDVQLRKCLKTGLLMRVLVLAPLGSPRTLLQS